jgi:hypothetical protein
MRVSCIQARVSCVMRVSCGACVSPLAPQDLADRQRGMLKNVVLFTPGVLFTSNVTYLISPTDGPGAQIALPLTGDTMRPVDSSVVVVASSALRVAVKLWQGAR